MSKKINMRLEERIEARKLPGDSDFWLFIALDAAVFTAICLVMSHYRTVNPEEFDQGYALISPFWGLVNTLVLLTSSFFVAKAVVLVRQKYFDLAKRYYLYAMGCGIAFILIKIFEYYKVISNGAGYSTSDFFSYYFSFTGLHAAHVFIGLILLWLSIRNECSEKDQLEKGLEFVESAGVYWHLVDVIWIFLFMLIYLN